MAAREKAAAPLYTFRWEKTLPAYRCKRRGIVRHEHAVAGRKDLTDI